MADEDFRMGGRLNAETFDLGGASGADWAARTVAELASMPNVRQLPRTTVNGAFDHGIYGAVERVSDHIAVPAAGKPRQILWRIYSRRAILAAGELDVILLAGKGHESYQEIAGVRTPFSDIEQAQAALALRQQQKQEVAA